MKLNELRIHYCYPRIDSWLLWALYANEISKGRSKASITREYDALNLKKYASSGNSITSNDRATNEDMIKCTKYMCKLFKEVISKNDDMKYIEIGIRFLFDKELCKRFTGRKHLSAYRYGYNTIHAFKPLYYPLLIEDIFVELDDEQAIRYLRSFPHWREEKFVIDGILAAKHDKETLIVDTKAFIYTFLDIYENYSTVKKIKGIRGLIDKANQEVRRFRGYLDREEEEALRFKTQRDAAERAERERIRRERDRAIKRLREKLNAEFFDEVKLTIPPKFENNACISAILMGAWMYWMREVCKCSDDIIRQATNLCIYNVDNMVKLTEIRLAVARDKENKSDFPLAIGKDRHVNINWGAAMVCDYCILENVFREGLTLEEFASANSDTLRLIAMRTLLPQSLITSTQLALIISKRYSAIVEFVADRMIEIVSRDPISTHYITEQEAAEIWEKKQNTTATQSST